MSKKPSQITKPNNNTNPRSPAQQGVLYESVESLQVNSPYPPPEWLARYDEVLPGMAQEIVDGVREQRQHRIELENKYSKAAIHRAAIGQVTGFLFGLAALGVAALAIWVGAPLVGLATVITALVAGVALFITNKRQQKNELEQKAPPENPSHPKS